MGSQEFLHSEVVQKAHCDRLGDEVTVIIRRTHGRAACKHFSEGAFIGWAYGTCKLASKIFFPKKCYFFQKPRKITIPPKSVWEKMSSQERAVILNHFFDQEDIGEDN